MEGQVDPSQFKQEMRTKVPETNSSLKIQYLNMFKDRNPFKFYEYTSKVVESDQSPFQRSLTLLYDSLEHVFKSDTLRVEHFVNVEMFAALNINQKFRIMRDRTVLLKDVFACPLRTFIDWAKQYSLVGNRQLSEFKIANDTIVMNNEELRSLQDSILRLKLTNSLFNLFQQLIIRVVFRYWVYQVENAQRALPLEHFLGTLKLSTLEDQFLDSRTQLVLCKFIDDHVRTLTTEQRLQQLLNILNQGQDMIVLLDIDENLQNYLNLVLVNSDYKYYYFKSTEENAQTHPNLVVWNSLKVQSLTCLYSDKFSANQIQECVSGGMTFNMQVTHLIQGQNKQNIRRNQIKELFSQVIRNKVMTSLVIGDFNQDFLSNNSELASVLSVFKKYINTQTYERKQTCVHQSVARQMTENRMMSDLVLSLGPIEVKLIKVEDVNISDHKIIDFEIKEIKTV